MTNSRVLRKLRAGQFVTTIGVGRVPHPWFAEMIGRTGFDLIWLDLEHRAWGYEIIDPISLACRATGIDLMVRIHKSGYFSPMQALEFGANGLMVPHCRSAQEARQWVEWVRFPPQGRRGFDGAGADADFGLAPPLEHMRHANREVFLVLQIEDREALEEIDAIAAVPGVDLLFVGTGDLSISLGCPMELEHPRMLEAYRMVDAAVKKAGNWWGIPTGGPEAARKALERGARLITCGSDHRFLVGGLKQAFAEFSGVTLGQ